MTRWTIVALGVLVIAVAAAAPWCTAQTVGGSATLAGWGGWRTTGDLNASLRPLPLAVLVCLAAGFMIYGAWRNRFGAALLGAFGTVVAGILPSMLMSVVDRRLPGSDSVAVDLAAAPILVVVMGLVALTVCWLAHARGVLRTAPRDESRAS
jgi:hypothetical protein